MHLSSYPFLLLYYYVLHLQAPAPFPVTIINVLVSWRPWQPSHYWQPDGIAYKNTPWQAKRSFTKPHLSLKALFLCHSQFSVSLWTTLSPCVLYQDLTPLLLPIFPVPFSVIIVADTVRKEDIHIQYIHIQDIGRKSRDKEEW